MKDMHISIVSPVYNSQNTLDELISIIESAVVLTNDAYEIILVEDGSLDNSWQVMKTIAAKNNKVRIVKLSRNFGQHYAITAGLDCAIGEWVVVMDCDLQDRPEEIINMLAAAKEKNAKIVLGQRLKRDDNMIKIWVSRFFYRVLSYLSGSSWDPSIANFGLYHRDVIKAIGKMREPIRFFPAMVKWVGFNCIKMPVTHYARNEGKSNYTLDKRLKLAMDIVLASSDKPLRIIVKFGFTMALVSGSIGVYYILRYLRGQIIVLGYTSLIISIWFVGGVILMLLGIIGLYIGKIFEAAKERPIYIVEEIIN